jgi:hypothetical protein
VLNIGALLQRYKDMLRDQGKIVMSLQGRTDGTLRLYRDKNFTSAGADDDGDDDDFTVNFELRKPGK